VLVVDIETRCVCVTALLTGLALLESRRQWLWGCVFMYVWVFLSPGGDAELAAPTVE
jgi:hypothetical protein